MIHKRIRQGWSSTAMPSKWCMEAPGGVGRQSNSLMGWNVKSWGTLLSMAPSEAKLANRTPSYPVPSLDRLGGASILKQATLYLSSHSADPHCI